MRLLPRSTLVSGAVLVALGACGTTYDVPVAAPAQLTQAKAMFAEEQNPTTTRSGQRLSGGLAVSQYQRVVSRVEPVAEQFCRTQTADKPAFECDVTIVVDTRMPYSNAYQQYVDGKPVVAFTLPLIADARNEDELAFVLGHEFGHHIGEHIKKQQQQAMAGALIAGIAMAYAQSGDTYTPDYVKQQNIENSMSAGAAIGQMAYSQTYELESDVIGTYIAKAAGYDPVKGARFFARPEPARTPNGALSFWGTHPSNEKRLATVIATAEKIEGGAGLD